MLNLNEAAIAETQSDELIAVSLYEVFYDIDGGSICYTNWDEAVSYNGKVYEPTAIKHTDLSQSADGKLNDVTLTVGNADRIIQFYVETYDLVGKRVKVTQLFMGSSTGSIQGTFKIKSVVVKKDQAQFVLSTGIDYLRSELPRRFASARHCCWQFKSVECGYEGSDEDCEKTFDACAAKGNVERIGCFPGIINDKIYI